MDLMQRTTVLVDGTPTNYAFGLSLGEYRGLPTAGHSGSWASFRTTLIRFPTQRLTVIVLANSARFDSDGVARQIAELYLEEEIGAAPAAAPHLTPGPESSAEPSFKMGPDALAQYVGRYFSPELETFYNLTVEEDELVAVHRRHGRTVLTPTVRDRFSGRRPLGTIAFERDEDGAVSRMLISSGSRARDLRFERQNEPALPG